MKETTTGDMAILYAPDGESKVVFRDEPKQDKPSDYERMNTIFSTYEEMMSCE